MTRTVEEWEDVRKQRGFVMPKAAWYKRLWVIRHVRAVWKLYAYLKNDKRASPYTSWLCHGIWLGKEEKR
jgi:hypothetical protein